VVLTVLEERSTASLPFSTSLVTWLNNASWMLYGYFVAQDKLIYGPNILGFLLSSTQMLLFLLYGVHHSAAGAATPASSDSSSFAAMISKA
jgi:hypothetical protein